MKKILSIILISFLLNACRYIDTSEKYIYEKSAQPLTIPADMDKPNSTSTLEIPDVKDKTQITEATRVPPPDMPIRKKQSDDGHKRIEVIAGLPTIVAQVSKQDMWNAMNNIKLENWVLANSDENSCQVILKYTDADAEERKKANFIKKLFRRKDYYSDFSGTFKLDCSTTGNVTQTTFSQANGNHAKSFLVDAVLENLYQQL